MMTMLLLMMTLTGSSSSNAVLAALPARQIRCSGLRALL